jgi:RHS repeat-associated protein
MPEETKTYAGKNAGPIDARGGLPSISLPKGGGAIRGIGEKFGTNPVTGTGSLSVPIFTSPSRSDFYPKLSLNYDSGSSNGPFGLGWSLSVPSITRKTDKGLPRYVDADDSDIFILSDAEDLIPALVQNGGSWVPNVFSASLNAQSYKVTRYRPRVEAAFSRIERWTNVATGASFWKTVTRDNITSLFGLSAAGQIVNPQDISQVFKWLLDRSYDSHGNVVVYEYKPENSDNIPSVVYEANRSAGANRYLKRICYGSQTPYYPDDAATKPTPLPSVWCFQVVFDYGEHDPSIPTPTEAIPWNARADPFSSYRSTFEVRSYRLCRRVLMFHHFEELGIQPCLVRSTDFIHTPNPIGTYLTSIKQTGYIRSPLDQSYKLIDSSTNAVLSPLSMPPLEFHYSTPQIDPSLHFVDSASVENLPEGVDGTRYRWIDLENDGLTGILTEQGGNWFYKRNTSNLARDPNGRVVPDDSPVSGTVSAYFESLRTVARKPSLAALSSGRQQLLDLVGNGRKCLVQYAEPISGFYEKKEGDGWYPFTPFSCKPNVDWNDLNLRFVDLDGDGFPDILVTENDVFTWYSSWAKDGFGPANRVAKPFDEDEGPALIFADGTESVYLADFSGDGLTDIVRIRNGEVCYWPNLGYGRFGAKITMDGSPIFDLPDQFEQNRIRLADIDGSGTTDIIYLGRAKTTFWFNESGNSWSDAQELPELSATDNADSVAVLDLLGNGTACIVWSSPLPGDSERPMHYIDLMSGQKPHLLISVRNNLGAETQVQYAASTKFYLHDRIAGNPWITKLPFPVHVVEFVESFDYVSKTKLVSRYAYHHGFYDGAEREFRGFGMVEQFDTVSYSKFSGIGEFTQTPEIAGEEFHLPPIHTKTWYHTGAFFELGKILRRFEAEYYQGDPLFTPLPDTSLPSGLTGEEVREACRALKGKMLRSEVYADDGAAQVGEPYLIFESTCQLRLLQPRMHQKYGSFYSFESEAIDCHYERHPTDPRIVHSMNLAVDTFGNVTQSVAIGYPRRAQGGGPPLPLEQSKLLFTYTESDVANFTDQSTWYRIGLPVETRTFELAGIVPSSSNGQFRLDEMQATAPIAAQISFESVPNGTAQKRLIGRTRTLYLKDDLSGPLPAATIESLALPYESYKMVFTRGLLNNIYSAKIDSAALLTILESECGYQNIDGDGMWWIPSGKLFFSKDPKAPDVSFAKSHFYLPQGYIDPFENISTVQYDGYLLSVQQTQDALQNTITGQQHYRVMQSWQVTDPNQNRSGLRFDALGMVVATALMGKQGQNEGDVLDLSTTEASPKDDPTTRLEYNIFNWMINSLPNFAHSFARESHGAANLRWQETYSYSDGLGREVMKKIQAEPGLAPARNSSGSLEHDSAGNLIFVQTPTRWVGTGRTVFDNKGNPVKKYEPFFDSSPVYDDEKDLVQHGVTPILTYDALSRLIRTDFPDGTLSRVDFNPWQTTTWDQNDTVLESRWHTDRLSLPASDPQRDADNKTLAHANTPLVVKLDSLGREFLTIADGAALGRYQTTVELDIQGNQLSVMDALNRKIVTYNYSMLGNRLHQRSADAGERWVLGDINGEPLRGWNDRNFQLRHSYDVLRRPTRLFMQPQSAAEILAECTVYGEGMTSAVAQNLRTRLYQTYDAAGAATNVGFDFKGNLLSSSRQLNAQYEQTMDWSTLTALTDPQQIAMAAAPLLQAEIFSSSTTYDALNRPVTLAAPDASVIRLTFNDANLLEAISVNARGAATPIPIVTNVDYNARGQRNQIVYGNESQTAYSYDLESFRLTELKTTRSSDNFSLQDLTYAYDPVGNITSIGDLAQEKVYFKNQVVTAANSYSYDAIYRLSSSTGREHIGQLAQPQTTWDDTPRANQPLPTDGTAMRNYTESYSYDAVGNILQMVHQATNGNWTRMYAYDEPNPTPTNNRLTSNSVGALKEQFIYDAHGNMLQMQHLPQMIWDFKDQLQSIQRQVVNNGGAERSFYVYGSAGQRVRKITVTSSSSPSKERIYFGGFELYREYRGGKVSLERQTLHVMDDNRRVLMVETKTLDTTVQANASPSSVFRFQFDNHLGSACLELDDSSELISFEEYYSFGGTSYQSVSSNVQVSAKRYRYTSQERDEETGFCYHRVRYYAPWLGRWTNCDPAGVEEGPNLYVFVHNNAVRLIDPNGTQDEPPRSKKLVADLKRRIAPEGIAKGSGSESWKTPRSVKGFFKNEVRRTGSSSPYKWRTPEGLQAGHPLGQPYRTHGDKAPLKYEWQADNRHKLDIELGNKPSGPAALPEPKPGATPSPTEPIGAPPTAEAVGMPPTTQSVGASPTAEPVGTLASAPEPQMSTAQVPAATTPPQSAPAAEGGPTAGGAPLADAPPTEPSAPVSKGLKGLLNDTEGSARLPRLSVSGIAEGAAFVGGIAITAYDFHKAKTTEQKVEVVRNTIKGVPVGIVLSEAGLGPLAIPVVAVEGTKILMKENVIPESAQRAIGKTMVEGAFKSSTDDIEILEHMEVLGWRPFAPN